MSSTSVTIPESKEFYHNLLDAFLSSAKYSHDSYFELRIQKGAVRFKLSTTEKPWNVTVAPSFNKPVPRFRAPPPTLSTPPQGRVGSVNGPNQQPSSIQQPRKRRHGAVMTPSPSTQKASENASLMPATPANDPPEVLRQQQHEHHVLEISDIPLADNISEPNMTYTSEYETPNPFSVLSCNDDDDPTPDLAKTMIDIIEKKNPTDDSGHRYDVGLCEGCYSGTNKCKCKYEIICCYCHKCIQCQN